MKNFCLNLREHVTKVINYERKEMMPLKDLVLMIATKNILRLEIIVTILENIEVLLMIFATYDIKCQKKFQWCFTVVLHMIIIL